MKKRKIIIGGGVVLLCAIAVTGYGISSVRRNVRTVATAGTAHLSPAATTPFPAIDTSKLSAKQVSIINLARTEYAKHPVSYDQTMLTYSQGNKEAWCADFVSWIMLQTGGRYTNPNSGSWRIPGVFTLQEYYEAQSRYEPVGSYQPQPGDVAFYIGKNSLGVTTSHVALVIKSNGDTMTTIGGNENGKLRIDTQAVQLNLNRLVGFGEL